MTPPQESLPMPAALRAWSPTDSRTNGGLYAKDFQSLADSFRSQIYRSFCGPASIATVLRAYGVTTADQTTIFPSLGIKFNAFTSGMSLAELAALGQSTGLRSEIVYADQLALEEFRERLKSNLAREGDFVLVNYDRRVLQQSGAGHISPVGAYDEARDSFLVLDQAGYKYPFTWVPTTLLYQAIHTRDGHRFRGILVIHAYETAG
jgi:hypothetical protein